MKDGDKKDVKIKKNTASVICGKISRSLKSRKNIFENIMASIFPNLMKTVTQEQNSKNPNETQVGKQRRITKKCTAITLFKMNN